MSYFKIAVSVFVLWVIYMIFLVWFYSKPCHAQHYEDDCYSNDVCGGYYGDNTVIVDEYDVYDGYRGYSSYNARSSMVDHYDIERGYSGFSEINRRTGMVDHYNVELGYMGYSQVYLGR